ncbi:MAG: OFA family MFS transporter [Sporomusaceae bacterium]|nr:OFA family MFS transporter [Sporomusaceae bacterium]
MKNRGLIALAAVGIHICIGSVYAWSVLTKPIMAAMGFSLGATTGAFSIAILFLGLSAGFLGGFVEYLGPRRAGLLSAGFFGSGMLGTALALHLHSLPLLYGFYGIIGGIGLGIGYITPVSTLVKWFPENRGFATGLAIMGFGFASLIAGPAMQKLTASSGLVATFLILGVIYTAIIALSALYLAPPRPGDVYPAQRIVPEQERRIETSLPTDRPQLTRSQALRTWDFYALWWMFFINITCGIGLLAVASPLAQEVVGMDAAAAASMVGVIGLINGFGRIVWATISDWLGRSTTYILFFILETAAFWQLAQTTDSLLFQTLVFVVIACYGGGFSCMPAYLSDLFGVRQLSAIHGCILTAWGLAGIAGPLIVSLVKETTGSYIAALQLFAILFVLNLAVAVVMKRRAAGAEAAWTAQQEL